MTLPSTFVELCRTILIFAYCFYNIHMLQCHHKLTMLFSTKAKNPRTAFRGFFYSVLLWRLNPQANGRIRERSPDFQMGFCHIKRQPPTPTKKAGPDILLSCHFSYLLSSFYFFIFYLQNFDSFSFSSRYLHSLACTNSGTSSIFSGLSFPSIICTYS